MTEFDGKTMELAAQHANFLSEFADALVTIFEPSKSFSIKEFVYFLTSAVWQHAVKHERERAKDQTEGE